MPRGDALEHLEADGPLTQRDIGERLSLTSGAVTMLVDRLERAGWVHRRPHPGDRRYVLIELLPRAAAAAPEGLTAYHSRVRALAAEVPAGQREAVAAFLGAAADAAAAAVTQLARLPASAGRQPMLAGREPPRPHQPLRASRAAWAIWLAEIPAASISSAGVPEPGRPRTARWRMRTG